MNVLFAFVIASVIYVVGLPVRVNPAVIGHVEPGSAEEKQGVREGDRIVAVNGKPVRSWEDAQMIAAMAPTNILPVTLARDGVTNTYYLTAQVNEDLGLKILGLEPMAHPIIRQVFAPSAASATTTRAGWPSSGFR